MNTFDVLSLPVSLTFSEEDIKDAFTCSPQGETELSARNLLIEPSSRLAEWMKIKGIPQNKHATLPNDLINLFSKTAKVIGTVKELTEKHKRASSLLTRTLLNKELFEKRSALEEISREIQSMEKGCLTKFSEIEKVPNEELVNETLQTLKFLRKWSAQVNEAFGLLFV